jgi:LacI family transcriptional regulator
MGKNRITIHDVAAKADVAISSVSRVLSGHRDVSEKMRAKVVAAVAELGYEPDHLAQSLRKGATNTIGFMIRDITNPLFSIVAQSAEYELRKAGYSIILINSHGDLDAEKENFALFKRRRIDGVIASLVSEDSPYVRNTINELGAPVVLLDREVTGLNASAVICDHAQGVKQATADLLANGYKRIAFVSGRKDVFISRNRIKGYEQALADAKIKIDEDLIRLGKFGEEFAYEQTKDLFSGKNKPTALITGGIGASTGALRALKELKIKPGSDIAFVALDDWPMFEEAIKAELRQIRQEENAHESHEISRRSLPKDANVIGSMMILLVKRKPDGTIDKYKARLVMLRNLQKESSYGSIKSGTVRNSTVKLLIALQAKTRGVSR